MEDLLINAAQYIEAAFPPDLLTDNEIVLISRPAEPFTDENGLKVFYNAHQIATPRLLKKVSRSINDSNAGEGWLFCVSAVRPLESGRVKARLSDVNSAFVFPLDDVGTKSKTPSVAPSVILETSPGNFQYHYFLNPFDVSTPAGQDYYDSCLVASAAAGINDPGVRAASRLMKLPNAVHKSGFVTRVVGWNPEKSWDLPALMSALGLTVVVRAGRRQRSTPTGQFNKLSDVSDGLWLWLRDNWPIRSGGKQWIGIACPWESQHSTGAGSPTSTGYSPKDYGTEPREFKCLHAGCAEHRNTQQFLELMRQKGATWSD